jgi:hypothetical protein
MGKLALAHAVAPPIKNDEHIINSSSSIACEIGVGRTPCSDETKDIVYANEPIVVEICDALAAIRRAVAIVVGQ